jgi:hypothetical protein
MTDHIDEVMKYIATMERWRDQASEKGELLAVKNYTRRIDALAATIHELRELRRITKPLPASYGDVSDLPDELLRELSGIKVDELEQQLYSIVAAGDQVDLDAILIEMYRRFSVIQTRRFLQNKLYRMSQKEIIFPVPSRKGVYSSKPLGSASESDRKPGENQLLLSGSKTVSSHEVDEDVPF